MKKEYNRKQDRTPLVDALKQYQEDRPAYFCIPGHRFERGVSRRWLSEEECGFLRYDLTEATGLDDLHQPSGVILESQELMADLYGAKKSYFLINGSTCGNEAMILAVLREGEKILLPRNVHKSVLEGIILSGAKPVYMMPEWIGEEGIYGGVLQQTVEEKLMEHPDCKAVFLVSPNYYGLTSNLKQIADICHENGTLLLVDEAHGGHLYFSDKLPDGALTQGADMCVQSFHKVTGALTQSSVLHIGTGRVDERRVERALKLVQSTSPSYLLMASLDAARYELASQGEDMMEKSLALSDELKEGIRQIPGMFCMNNGITGKYGVQGIDGTRVVIRCGHSSGYELKRRLMEEHRIELELADEKNVLAIITHANTREDIRRFLAALTDIAEQPLEYTGRETDPTGLPETEMVLTPREAYFSVVREVPWEMARGKIAGELIAPYPPGIPLVYPGERLSDEIWNAVEMYRRWGCHFHGPSDDSLSMFEIIEK
ncbi:aminotransferase class I/II-fold pyridoxal phosphate-dependent enzyme [Ruminococcus sp. OA3]|uniref:aminotransferase class I/II-fold pyridoxal phosphate-dependent enzyme n=1 Tax=Ruminococcus sp. OA3 TaxID=2914164 RepID=UPI001F061818|nr:aminotransferase class I/II-fold pyridoxal phosphate-dependent enzyme [Ruminococcus sp. OA3]MCH1983834.1 aminotransferase class I/II-fold pyridoxal phosphate-dependent enzyme [Ruminococcus sp. OA3]